MNPRLSPAGSHPMFRGFNDGILLNARRCDMAKVVTCPCDIRRVELCLLLTKPRVSCA